MTTAIKHYTMTGDKGTLITVSVVYDEDINCALSTDHYIHTLADGAPEFYGDAISMNDAEFVVGKLYECDMQTGDTWSVAFEDGDITHTDMAEAPEFVELFTITLDSLESLANELLIYCKAHGLPLQCAHETLHDNATLSADQVQWLTAFVARWDYVEGAII